MKVMTKEEFDKLTPEQQEQVKKEFKTAQAEAQKKEERKKLHLVMTWDLVKIEAQDIGVEEIYSENFKNCADAAEEFLNYMEERNNGQERKEA